MSNLKIGDIAVSVFTGLSKHGRSLVLSDEDPRQQSSKDGLRIPLLSSGSIVGERVDASKAEQVRVTDREKASRYFVYPDDVLIVCRGTQVRSAVVPDKFALHAITVSLIAVRLKPNTLLPILLSAYLNHPATIQTLIRGSTSHSDNVNISANHVSNLPVAIPSDEIQSDLSVLYMDAIENKQLANTLADDFIRQSRQVMLSHLLGL